MKRKGFIPILVVVLLALAALSTGGYLWYQNQPPSEEEVGSEEITYSDPCDPRIPFTTFTDPDFGYSIQYPETWFIESYEPGERWAVSAVPENIDPEMIPYTMLAIATIDGDFGPDYSEEGEVARVFLSRFIFDPGFDLDGHLATLRQQSEEQGYGLDYQGEWITVGTLEGSVLTVTGDNYSWINRDVSLDLSPYTYSLDAGVWVGPEQEACLSAVDRIQNSFTLISQ